MTQRPLGRIYLRRQDQVEEVDLGPPEDLYTRAVGLFNGATRGDAQPAATGDDGVRSLAVGLAVLESAQSGQRVRVRYE